MNYANIENELFKKNELKIDIADVANKKLIIIGDEYAGRIALYTKLQEAYLGIKLQSNRTKLKNVRVKEKLYNLYLLESTGYEENSTKLHYNDLSRCDGFIFVFSKYNSYSYTYIQNFKEAYHELIGKKYFPSIYVQNEFIDESHSSYYDTDPLDDELLKQITENRNFPLVNTSKNFDLEECKLIVKRIVKEIEKESKDEFPYSLQYMKEVKLNFWVKYFKNFYLSSFILMVLVIFFSLYDLYFIISSQDFINEEDKVDGLYLGTRLNFNAVNIVTTFFVIKTTIFSKEKLNRVRKFEKFTVIFNILAIILLGILHLRIKHLSNHNEDYYQYKLYHFVDLFIFISVFYIFRNLTKTEPQVEVRPEADSRLSKKLKRSSSRNSSKSLNKILI